MNQKISTILRIWRGEFPQHKPRSHSLLEKLIYSLLLFIRCLSLENIRPSSDVGRHIFMDLYVFGFALVATAGLFPQFPRNGWLAALLIYRIADIVTYRVYFLLIKSQEQPWKTEMLRRSIVIVALNFYESTVDFAILYRITGQVCDQSGQALASSISSLYFSLVTMATLGYGDFLPKTDLTRAIVMCQIVTSLLLLAFIVPAIVSLFSADRAPAATK